MPRQDRVLDPFIPRQSPYSGANPYLGNKSLRTSVIRVRPRTLSPHRSALRGHMSEKPNPIAVKAADVPARSKPSVYPEPFASRMAGREKRQLGDLFGLTNFAVNLTRLTRNAVSALRHPHEARRIHLHPARAADTAHRRRPNSTRAGNVRGLQGGYR